MARLLAWSALDKLLTFYNNYIQACQRLTAVVCGALISAWGDLSLSRDSSGDESRGGGVGRDPDLPAPKLTDIMMKKYTYTEGKKEGAMSSCVGLLPASDVTRNNSEYGFFNQGCATWQYHLIQRLLNVGGTTPPSPTLRRTDQAGRTTILVRRNTLLTSFRSREEITSHTYSGRDPIFGPTGTQAGHNPRPCSNTPLLRSQPVIGHSCAVHIRCSTMEGAVQAWNDFFNPGAGGTTTLANVAEHVFLNEETKPLAVEMGTVGKPHGLGGGSPFITRNHSFASSAKVGFPDESEGEENNIVFVYVFSTFMVGTSFVTRVCRYFLGINVHRVMDAVEALEGHMSQLEVDKWELMMQMAYAMQEMASMSIKEKKKLKSLAAEEGAH
ncbi:hypothetical protein PIB30_056331 [Stylosanthes scabra]|uniref:Uncharacterized protein n=1 Tax=Stylosanthes scabra TaxID=79078 RepID=A0ABU6UIU5_9FABA|nr:hypothetical protein [Stylosanthes scabra]